MSIRIIKRKSARALALILLAGALAAAHLPGLPPHGGGRHPSAGAPLTLPALADGSQVGTGGG